MTTTYANEYDYNKVLDMNPFTPFSTEPDTDTNNNVKETNSKIIVPISKKKITVKSAKKIDGEVKLIADEDPN